MITNIRIFILLSCLYGQINFSLLFPQTSDYFVGKILDSSTQEPVPFATICLKNSQLCVYANAEGDFKILRNPVFQKDSLIITRIGYKRFSLAYENLLEQKSITVYLKPALYELEEVKVVARRKKLNSLAILRKAIRNIDKNYPHFRYNYISYYRDYQKKDGDYFNLNEAIIQTLENGIDSASTKNKYRMLDFRKNMEFGRMNISPYYDSINSMSINNSNKSIPNAKLSDQNGNELFILMVHDAIRNYNTCSFSFIDTFSRNFLKNHVFSEPTGVFNNNLLLYKIDFKYKYLIAGDSIGMAGEIFIQPKDYSIHKLNYICFYKINKEEKKVLYNVDVEYGYNNSVDSLLCLKYISFNNIFNITDTTDIDYFRIIDSFWEDDKPRVIIKFSNLLDPVSASEKDNYKIIIENKIVKIKDIQVIGNKVYLDLKYDKSNRKGSIQVQNIKDISGNIVYKRKTIEFYQYRELFVQEVNKVIINDGKDYLKQMPLEKNTLYKQSCIDKYWMNTPKKLNQ